MWGANSRLARTLRDYINPGVYTRNWLDKKQARYISPVKMFLSINLVYFLILSVLSQYELNFDTFVTPLEIQVESQIYSYLISEITTDVVVRSGFEMEDFERMYNSRVFAISNSLIIILSLLIAIVFYVVNFRKSSLVYHHIIMGLYFGGYILLFFIVINLFLVPVFLLLSDYLNPNLMNFLFEFGVALLYLFLSFFTQLRMYNEPRWVSFLKSILITLLITFVGIILYRFILFWITMASVLVFS